MRKIRIYLMGGTIASKIDEHGKYKIIDLKDFVNESCDFGSEIHIEVNSFNKLAGFETKIEDLLRLTDELNRAIRKDNLDGIVVVMGTNVMEEISFGIHLLVPTKIPIVVTGAMRIATAVSADGPSNLISAIAAASDPVCRDMGTLVVFNEEIYSAQYVKKMHASSTAAFKSEFLLGYIVEGKASIRTRPLKRPLPWIHVPENAAIKDVLLYESYFSDTGRILEALSDIKYDGLVVDGTGCGSIPSWILDKIEILHKKMPVVIASRTGHGDVLTATYGTGYGMPQYYVENNYLNAGILDARKARVLLTLLLMSNCSQKQIVEGFRSYSREFGGVTA